MAADLNYEPSDADIPRLIGQLFPDLDAFYRRAVEKRIGWLDTARAEQLMPNDSATVWLVLAGRGFGKSRCGAEHIVDVAVMNPGVRCAVVGPTFRDTLATCFEGESGILACLPEGCERLFQTSKLELTLPNGSIIFGYSAESPERLRGPQHHAAWCDELCAWMDGGTEAWSNLEFTMRLGANPHIVVTTTPKPTRLLYEILDDPETAVTRGSTYDNAKNLPRKFLKNILKYEGTERGKQEIHAEVLDRDTGAILKRRWWMKWGGQEDQQALPQVERVIISLDSAFKANKRSDFSACTIWGLFRHEYEVTEEHPVFRGREISVRKTEYCCLLMGGWKAKLKYPDLRERMQKLHTKWAEKLAAAELPEPVVLIEDKGSGQSLAQEMDRAGVSVVPYNPGHDSKLTRAHLASDLLKDGLVWVYGLREGNWRTDRHAQWAEDVIRECESFTGTEKEGEHDDFVDSAVQAWQYWRNEGFLSKDSDKDFDAIDPEDDGDDGEETEARAPFYA